MDPSVEDALQTKVKKRMNTGSVRGVVRVAWFYRKSWKLGRGRALKEIEWDRKYHVDKSKVLIPNKAE